MDLSQYKKEIRSIDYYANRLYYGLSSFAKTHLDRDDLVQAGYLGLMDAVNKSKAMDKELLSTYASIRIHGSMIDCIRSFTPLSKHLIRTPQKYPTVFLAIDDHLFDEQFVEPDVNTDMMDMEDMLSRMKPGRTKRIVDMYLMGLYQKDIGIMEGISESRVSQLIRGFIKETQEEYFI